MTVVGHPYNISSRGNKSNWFIYRPYDGYMVTACSIFRYGILRWYINTPMSIKDFITTIIEGRDAPLYHWVDDKKLFAILRRNEMGAYWEHTIPWHANRYVEGNSMSRNAKLVWGGGVVRLTFDQRLLAMTHKIIPLDAERTFHQHAQGMDDFTPDRDKEPAGMDASSVLAEEFVIGDIKPLNKYLLEIEYGGSDPQIKGVIRTYAHEYGIKVV